MQKATDTVDLNIHGITPEFKSIPSFGKFKRSLSIPNSGLKGFRVSVIYKNFLNNFSECSILIQPNLQSDESIIDITSKIDFEYPNKLEDIEPYLFRTYLHDSNSESEVVLEFNFNNNIVSGSQLIKVHTDPLYSPVHVSERLVVVPNFLVRPEDQTEVQKNLISGWVGARENLNYEILSTGQKVTAQSFITGIMIVQQFKENLPRIISGINSDMTQDPRSLSFDVIAGFGVNLCSAENEITIKIQSLNSQFNLNPRFNGELPDTKVDIVLNRVGNTKTDNDYHYYQMKVEKLIVNHQKSLPNLKDFVQVSGFGGGFLEASNAELKVDKPIVQATFLRHNQKIDIYSDKGAWYSEPNYILPSILIPKIKLENIDKSAITISEDSNTFKANFEVSGVVEDFVADIVEKEQADLKYILVNGEMVNLKRKQIKAHHFYQSFVFIGEYNKTITVPVVNGHNLIPVKTSRNSSGNSCLVLIDIDFDIKNKKVKSVDIIYRNLESIFNPFIPTILGGIKYTENIKTLKLAVNEKDKSLFGNFEFETITKLPYFSVQSDIYRQNAIVFLEEKIAKPMATNLESKMGEIIESINVHEYSFDDVLINKTAGKDELKTQLQTIYVDIVAFNAENKLVESIDELEYGLTLRPNIDDDNANGNTDNLENNPSANDKEDDLGRIVIKFNQIDLLAEGKGKLTLSYKEIEKDVGKIRIWSGEKLILDDKKKNVELTKEDLSNEFKIEGYEAGEMYLKLSFTMNDYEAVDIIKVNCFVLDLDVDSDNTVALEEPEGTFEEDNIEDIENDENYPGKIIIINDGDVDGDGLKDFAENFNTGEPKSLSGSSSRFYSLKLDTPSGYNYSGLKIRFNYDESDPADLVVNGNGSFTNPFTYTNLNGTLRIWTKDGDKFRNKADLNASGDFVKKGEIYELSQLPTLLFIEGISASKSVADITIKAEIGFGNKENFEVLLEDTVSISCVKSYAEIISITDDEYDGEDLEVKVNQNALFFSLKPTTDLTPLGIPAWSIDDDSLVKLFVHNLDGSILYEEEVKTENGHNLFIYGSPKELNQGFYVSCSVIEFKKDGRIYNGTSSAISNKYQSTIGDPETIEVVIDEFGGLVASGGIDTATFEVTVKDFFGNLVNDDTNVEVTLEGETGSYLEEITYKTLNGKISGIIHSGDFAGEIRIHFKAGSANLIRTINVGKGSINVLSQPKQLNKTIGEIGEVQVEFTAPGGVPNGTPISWFITLGSMTNDAGEVDVIQSTEIIDGKGRITVNSFYKFSEFALPSGESSIVIRALGEEKTIKIKMEKDPVLLDMEVSTPVIAGDNIENSVVSFERMDMSVASYEVFAKTIISLHGEPNRYVELIFNDKDKLTDAPNSTIVHLNNKGEGTFVVGSLGLQISGESHFEINAKYKDIVVIAAFRGFNILATDLTPAIRTTVKIIKQDEVAKRIDDSFALVTGNLKGGGLVTFTNFLTNTIPVVSDGATVFKNLLFSIGKLPVNEVEVALAAFGLAMDVVPGASQIIEAPLKSFGRGVVKLYAISSKLPIIKPILDDILELAKKIKNKEDVSKEVKLRKHLYNAIDGDETFRSILATQANGKHIFDQKSFESLLNTAKRLEDEAAGGIEGLSKRLFETMSKNAENGSKLSAEAIRDTIKVFETADLSIFKAIEKDLKVLNLPKEVVDARYDEMFLSVGKMLNGRVVNGEATDYITIDNVKFLLGSEFIKRTGDITKGLRKMHYDIIEDIGEISASKNINNLITKLRGDNAINSGSIGEIQQLAILKRNKEVDEYEFVGRTINDRSANPITEFDGIGIKDGKKLMVETKSYLSNPFFAKQVDWDKIIPNNVQFVKESNHYPTGKIDIRKKSSKEFPTPVDPDTIAQNKLIKQHDVKIKISKGETGKLNGISKEDLEFVSSLKDSKIIYGFGYGAKGIEEEMVFPKQIRSFLENYSIFYGVKTELPDALYDHTKKQLVNGKWEYPTFRIWSDQ